MTIDYWSGPDGIAYTIRNLHVVRENKRETFWKQFLETYPIASVLEVGCGAGPNLRNLVAENRRVVGVDVNEVALSEANKIKGVLTFKSQAHKLPLPDASFQLVVSSGVLIHVHPSMLEKTMDELWRVSSRYLFIAEYESPEEQEIEYRGKRSLLWKRPYRDLFAKKFNLNLVEGWELDKDQGFDRVTATLWEKA